MSAPDAPGIPGSKKGRSRGPAWPLILGVALAAPLLYFSLHKVDWRRVWQTIAGARWEWLAAACGIMAGAFLLRALRWRILLNAGERFGIGTVFCATMAGYLGNSFLPARAGELVRTMVVSSRSSLSKTYVLTTALSERLMDAITLVLWSSLILLNVKQKPAWMEDVSRTTALVAAAGAVAIAVLPHTGGLCRMALDRLPLPDKLRERLGKIVDQVLLGVRAFHNVGRFAGFAAFTVAIWVADTFTTMAGARALGLHVSFRVAMLLIAGLGLGSALPSTPGYVGIYQFVAVTVLVPFGMDRASAVAYILVAQAMGYVMVLVLGLPCLYALRRAGVLPRKGLLAGGAE